MFFESRSTRGPLPNFMMTELEKAYAAGLFDGEGTAGIFATKSTKNGKKYLKVMARIANTDIRCLRAVQTSFGRGGIVISHHANGKNKLRDCFNFVAANSTAIDFLTAIRPYLKVKCDVVDFILGQPHSGAAPENYRFQQPLKTHENNLSYVESIQ